MADRGSRAGHGYGTPEVRAFVDSLHGPHDGPLAAAFGAPDDEGLPAIQVAPAEGAFLTLLAAMISARRAVEIGTLAGYSAIRLARGMAEGGRLYTIERDPKHAAVARARIAAAGLADRVEIVEGDAAERLGDLERHGPFDLVFLDADKGRYDVYGRWAARHLAPGGLLVADNAYFFGRLLDPHDADAAAMRRFHREAAQVLLTACVPTPDGLLVGVKRRS
ncbi:MAG TPA: O-methyltransferase [Sandaracinaceae bacterium]